MLRFATFLNAEVDVKEMMDEKILSDGSYKAQGKMSDENVLRMAGITQYQEVLPDKQIVFFLISQQSFKKQTVCLAGYLSLVIYDSFSLFTIEKGGR